MQNPAKVLTGYADLSVLPDGISVGEKSKKRQKKSWHPRVRVITYPRISNEINKLEWFFKLQPSFWSFLRGGDRRSVFWHSG